MELSMLAMVDQTESFAHWCEYRFAEDSANDFALARARELGGRAAAQFESLESPSGEDKRRYQLANALETGSLSDVCVAMCDLARVERSSAAYEAALEQIPEEPDAEVTLSLMRTFRSAILELGRLEEQFVIQRSVSDFPKQ